MSAAAAEITKLLNDSITQARDLARGLGPVGLREIGLDSALEALAHDVEQMFRTSCTLECEGLIPRLDHEVEQHLFRIAQQAVHNAVAHSRGDRIEIRLCLRDGKVLLAVRDDGVGLSEGTRDSDGIGLHTMAYRARLIGASLEVRRRTRRGTVVSCVFQLPETPGDAEDRDHARHTT